MVQLGSGVEGHDGFAAPDGQRLASSSNDFHVYLGHRAKNAVSVHVAGEFKIAMAAARPCGLWRGCHNETVWQSVPEQGTVTVDISWPWGQDQPTSTCTPSNPQGYQCQDISQQAGRLEWALVSQ